MYTVRAKQYGRLGQKILVSEYLEETKLVILRLPIQT